MAVEIIQIRSDYIIVSNCRRIIQFNIHCSLQGCK